MDEFSISCQSDVCFSIRQSNSRACVVWKVKDFSSLSEEVPKCYNSPAFIFKNVRFDLVLYPFGGDAKNADKVGLYLRCSETSFKLKVQIIMKNQSGQDYKSVVSEMDFSQETGWGLCNFIARQDLLDGKIGNFLPNDVLTVIFKMAVVEKLETETETVTGSEKKSPDSPLSNFRESFDSGRFSDVVLRVGEEAIPAHKVILSAHSDVFRAMFDSDMKEIRDNAVDLADMDATVAKAMILFIYTREVEELSAEKTLQLYVAADKYMLTELKDKCREYLSRSMSPKNVGEVFEVASLHCDAELTKAAQDFFCANVMSILKLKEWKDFSAKKSSVSIELLSFVISNNDLY